MKNVILSQIKEMAKEAYINGETRNPDELSAAYWEVRTELDMCRDLQYHISSACYCSAIEEVAKDLGLNFRTEITEEQKQECNCLLEELYGLGQQHIRSNK